MYSFSCILYIVLQFSWKNTKCFCVTCIKRLSDRVHSFVVCLSVHLSHFNALACLRRGHTCSLEHLFWIIKFIRKIMAWIHILSLYCSFSIYFFIEFMYRYFFHIFISPYVIRTVVWKGCTIYKEFWSSWPFMHMPRWVLSCE